MALVHTIPTTDATIPAPVRQSGNGTLPVDWLRSFDGTTRTDYKMFAPIAYAMQALILAALQDGIRLTTTGRYRSLARQEALFLSRYSPAPFNADVHRTTPSIQRREWNDQVWYLLKGMAMAATPGTSNHGWGIADDICEAPDDPGGPLISLRDPALMWLRDNAHRFGFALDTWEERWHWHWWRPGNVTQLTQETVDVLHAAGVAVPDLSTFGFTAPAPTPPPAPIPDPPVEDDDMSKLFLARATANPNQLRRGDGNIATVLRSNEYMHAYNLLAQGKGPQYFHPVDGTPITKWSDVPSLNETELDLWVGYPAYEITLADEG